MDTLLGIYWLVKFIYTLAPVLRMVTIRELSQIRGAWRLSNIPEAEGHFTRTEKDLPSRKRSAHRYVHTIVHTCWKSQTGIPRACRGPQLTHYTRAGRAYADVPAALNLPTTMENSRL